MNKGRSGFMLLEAILTIVIVSICLTYIAQSLLTNFRAGLKFQEMTRAIIVMENQLGLLLVTSGSEDIMNASQQPVGKPYEGFTITSHATVVNDYLNKVDLQLNWPSAGVRAGLETSTIVYNSNQN